MELPKDMEISPIFNIVYLYTLSLQGYGGDMVDIGPLRIKDYVRNLCTWMALSEDGLVPIVVL